MFTPKMMCFLKQADNALGRNNDADKQAQPDPACVDSGQREIRSQPVFQNLGRILAGCGLPGTVRGGLGGECSVIGITDTTEERGVSTRESSAYEARVGNNPLVLFKSLISEDDFKEEDPAEIRIRKTHALSNTRLTRFSTE
jgi:hypothetical protein